MTAATTLELVRVLVTLAVLHQSLESLAMRRQLVWPWSIVRSDYAGWPWPARVLLDALASRSRTLDGTTAVAAALSLAIPALVPLALPVLVVSVAVASLRVRGSIGGASDCMTLHVLLAVWAGRAFPAVALEASVYFVAVQATLSYFLAGLAKIRHPDWRSGAALRRYATDLARPGYARLRLHPAAAGLAAWTVMGFECAFPLVLVLPQVTMVLIAVAAAFHVANAVVFGLHRFILPWLATYPALIYVAGA